VGCGRRS